ncbi:hypothetical protein CFOL_v3_08875, partial [Cephalotus follicularis]
LPGVPLIFGLRNSLFLEQPSADEMRLGVKDGSQLKRKKAKAQSLPISIIFYLDSFYTYSKYISPCFWRLFFFLIVLHKDRL